MRARSSVGQSSRLITDRSQVRALAGPFNNDHRELQAWRTNEGIFFSLKRPSSKLRRGWFDTMHTITHRQPEYVLPYRGVY